MGNPQVVARVMLRLVDKCSSPPLDLLICLLITGTFISGISTLKKPRHHACGSDSGRSASTLSTTSLLHVVFLNSAQSNGLALGEVSTFVSVQELYARCVSRADILSTVNASASLRPIPVVDAVLADTASRPFALVVPMEMSFFRPELGGLLIERTLVPASCHRCPPKQRPRLRLGVRRSGPPFLSHDLIVPVGRREGEAIAKRGEAVRVQPGREEQRLESIEDYRSRFFR